MEERISPGSYRIYWVDHRRVGSDVERAIEVIRSSGRTRVTVRSEYKPFDWGCRLRTQLVAAHLDVVSFFAASSVAPGWTDLNGDEYTTCQEPGAR